ncbi:DRTGG domain-containing protein [Caldicellulosiruptor morganii]|uniref:DRTGG domain-containing protein n=1 Tax=Caldicellulosiruptor morganii TaxID=1387555 RepID=A0ABY7BJ92_9FIRM|nr:DRTGG domain-containing protein [Caldicellulosiruptor morganii]WAM32884.1 DRTGG domain-containing protein [Caldicellulosiruptor morganii]
MPRVSHLKKYFNLVNDVVKDDIYENVYIGDILSFAISHIKDNSIWITIQNNVNVIAIATLRDVKAIILTEGVKPDTSMLNKSKQESIPVFTTELSHFETAKLLILQEKEGRNETLL